jgi:hypothetical protein
MPMMKRPRLLLAIDVDIVGEFIWKKVKLVKSVIVALNLKCPQCSCETKDDQKIKKWNNV